MASNQRILSPWVVLQSLIFVVLVPLLPLIISWRWNWWEAWAYAALAILGFCVSRFLAARRHPDLLAERARFMQHEDAKAWDRILVRSLALASTAILVVTGIEARFHLPAGFAPWTKVLSLGIILTGYALGSWALIENSFFSAMVRLQVERGHRVVSSGPYGWIRHPGYAGGLLTYLGTPLLLDSRWAYIPTALTLIVLIVRTHLEDTTLQEELPGYADYARRVRYRLLPGIW